MKNNYSVKHSRTRGDKSELNICSVRVQAKGKKREVSENELEKLKPQFRKNEGAG